MPGIDTNVLVRFLVRDDEAQFEKARRLIKREVGAGENVFVNLLVLLETEWVLRSRYFLRKTEIIDALTKSGGKRDRAAALLGMSRTTLWRKMKALGLLVDR